MYSKNIKLQNNCDADLLAKAWAEAVISQIVISEKPNETYERVISKYFSELETEI